MSGNTKEETEQQFVREAPVEEENGKKRTVFRGELALFYHGDDQQFWCGINVIFRCGNFRNLQCTICIFRGGAGHFTGYMDVYFQAALILSLMIMRKKFVPAYLFSFVVGFAFSELLDLHEAWIDILPKSLGFCVLYFCHQLSAAVHWHCVFQPLWTADHSDGLVSERIITDHRSALFQSQNRL